jgi:hypothetical protein
VIVDMTSVLNIILQGYLNKGEEMNLRSTLAPLLWKKWDVGEKDNEIIGYWAEDDSRYIISVPYQLRDTIIIMQRWLSTKYQTLEFLSSELKILSRFFDE